MDFTPFQSPGLRSDEPGGHLSSTAPRTNHELGQEPLQQRDDAAECRREAVHSMSRSNRFILIDSDPQEWQFPLTSASGTTDRGADRGRIPYGVQHMVPVRLSSSYMERSTYPTVTVCDVWNPHTKSNVKLPDDEFCQG